MSSEIMAKYSLTHLDDAALVAGLKSIVDLTNEATAVMLAHIAEVDARRIYLDAACASMHVYCVEVLNFADGAAYKRIHAARAARSFPEIFEMVASGDLHLAGITILAPQLTAANHLEILQKARRKSKRGIEELVASYAPKPDVPDKIRKLPDTAGVQAPEPGQEAKQELKQEPNQELKQESSPEPVHAPIDPQRAPTPPVPSPLSAERFKVQFTASRELHDKIRQAQDLLRHQIPSGDLAEVFDRAITDLVQKLLARKLGLTRSPRTSTAEAGQKRRRYVPAAVRRSVALRDGLQCAFVSSDGKRCSERAWLELQHDDPFAKGGEHDPEQMRLLCRAHNQHLADREYGVAFMAEKRAQAGTRADTQVDLSG
jgi:hypothetical protein